MKISVHSYSGRSGRQPNRLCLGQCCLPVVAVLDDQDEGSSHAFEVRVLDGRRFVVRHQTDLDQWDLVAVYGRTAKRRQPAHQPVTPLLVPILATLSTAAMRILKRATKLRSSVAHDLPSGDAPA